MLVRGVLDPSFTNEIHSMPEVRNPKVSSQGDSCEHYVLLVEGGGNPDVTSTQYITFSFL